MNRGRTTFGDYWIDGDSVKNALAFSKQPGQAKIYVRSAVAPLEPSTGGSDSTIARRSLEALMYRTNRFIGIATLLAVLVGGGALAASTAEAEKVLNKMAELVDKGPFEVDYSADLQMAAMGMPMNVTMGGHMTQTDRAHMRMTMDMSMSPEMGDEQGSMTINVLMVSDGAVMWTEMNNPIMGGKQVMKIGLDQAKKLAESPAGMGMAQMGSMDPISQIRQLTELFDFDVTERTDGEVKLSADMTPEALAKMGIPAEAASAMTSFVMIIDEKTGFPSELHLGGEEPLMVMRFSNFKSFDASKAEPGMFSYAPPEGVQVMDLGTMVDAMGGAPETE